MAVVGLLAGCGLVAGCVVAAGCAQPTAKPVEADAVPDLAEDTLLRPEEFGEPGWSIAPDSSPQPSTWAFAMPRCAAYDEAAYPAQRHRAGVRVRAFVHRSREARQWVERYAPGWAARSVADVRRVVGLCNRYEYGEHTPGAPGFRESHRIVDSGFAGDESVLVKTDQVNVPGRAHTRYTAVVRRGDLIVTLAMTGVDPGKVRGLARVAAARLG